MTKKQTGFSKLLKTRQERNLMSSLRSKSSSVFWVSSGVTAFRISFDIGIMLLAIACYKVSLSYRLNDQNEIGQVYKQKYET